MSLDLNLFCADKGGNPDLVRESQRRRGKPVEVVDRIIELHAQWRKLQGDISNTRGKVKAVNKKIGVFKKKKEEPPQELLDEKEGYAADIPRLEAESAEVEKARNKLLFTVGNLVHDSVPVCVDEVQKNNEQVKTWGGQPIPEGKVYTHRELVTMIGGYEPERGAAVAGASCYFLRGAAVELNAALVQYGLDYLGDRDFIPLQPPFFMNKEVMSETAQLEQFDEELYKVTGHHEDEKYLIATSEQPISAFHRNDWIEPKDLPIKYAGWSTNFRMEAGRSGREAWGLYRVHQFDKIEQFVLTHPEHSWEMFEELMANAEGFYQSIVAIVSGALNNAAAKKWDLEAWFPSFQEYKELVSCSNCTDYQARRLNVRLRVPKTEGKAHVHMLNSTLTATGRTICCLLENCQTPDGIKIPEVLRPYLKRYKDGIIPYVNKCPKLK